MPNAAFTPTRWTLVLAARGVDERVSVRALTELCDTYWYPLYAFARRQSLTPEDAEDAVQDFFARVLQQDLFAAADRSLGKLRTFLITVFARDLADARKAATRQKRGCGRPLLSLDAANAEERFAAEPHGSSPETEFQRQWALLVLDAAMARTEKDFAESGRSSQFVALRPFLTSEGSYDELCSALKITPAAARQAVRRMRAQFAAALRREIADTLERPTESEIDAELRALRRALAA